VARRIGPFWEAVDGRAPLPRAAATLGLEIVDVDTERNLLLVRGSVPGPNGGVVEVRSEPQ
jgi:hypothetical protein